MLLSTLILSLALSFSFATNSTNKLQIQIQRRGEEDEMRRRGGGGWLHILFVGTKLEHFFKSLFAVSPHSITSRFGLVSVSQPAQLNGFEFEFEIQRIFEQLLVGKSGNVEMKF